MGDLDKSGDNQEIVLVRAKASFNLINGYANADNLPEAQKIFDSMGDLDKSGDNKEIAVQRAEASVNLIYDYRKSDKEEDLQQAQKIFDEVPKLCDKIDEPEYKKKIVIYHAWVHSNLLYVYGNAGYLPKAQELFDAMHNLGEHEEMDIALAESSVDLISIYIKAKTADYLQQSQTIFDGMPDIGDKKEIAIFYAKASVNLISAYAEIKTADNLSKAQELFDAMLKLPIPSDNEEFIELRKEAQKILAEIKPS